MSIRSNSYRLGGQTIPNAMQHVLQYRRAAQHHIRSLTNYTKDILYMSYKCRRVHSESETFFVDNVMYSIFAFNISFEVDSMDSGLEFNE